MICDFLLKLRHSGCYVVRFYKLSFFLSFFFFFVFFRAAPVAHGGSQARGLIRAVAIGLRHSQQQHGIQAMSATYTTAHGNTRSLTHWARPAIEPSSSWILVGFVTTEPQRELLTFLFLFPLGLLPQSEFQMPEVLGQKVLEILQVSGNPRLF